MALLSILIAGGGLVLQWQAQQAASEIAYTVDVRFADQYGELVSVQSEDIGVRFGELCPGAATPDEPLGLVNIDAYVLVTNTGSRTFSVEKVDVLWVASEPGFSVPPVPEADALQPFNWSPRRREFYPLPVEPGTQELIPLALSWPVRAGVISYLSNHHIVTALTLMDLATDPALSLSECHRAAQVSIDIAGVAQPLSAVLQMP